MEYLSKPIVGTVLVGSAATLAAFLLGRYSRQSRTKSSAHDCCATCEELLGVRLIEQDVYDGKGLAGVKSVPNRLRYWPAESGKVKEVKGKVDNWDLVNALDYTEAELVLMLEEMFVSLGFVSDPIPHGTTSQQPTAVTPFPLLPLQNLRDLLLHVQYYYRQVPYHNFYHAFTVTQSAYNFIRNYGLDATFSPLELLSLLLAALLHDTDHPGLSNNFWINANSTVARLYSYDSPLERHHATSGVYLMEQTNLLEKLNAEQRMELIRLVVYCIHHTDMKYHHEVVAKLTSRERGVATVELKLAALTKCADISVEVRPRELCESWCKLLFSEFDREKELTTDSSEPFVKVPMSQRMKEQANFLAELCLPLFEATSRYFPRLESCVSKLREAHDHYLTGTPISEGSQEDVLKTQQS